MSTEKKITKKDILAAIRADIEGTETVGNIPTDVVLEFIDKTVAQIDAKAAKAKETANKKKAAGDELRAEVLSKVTDEFQTADAITAAIGKEDVSKSKVVSRLTQLFNAGDIVKEQMKVGDSKVMCYKLATAADAE